MQIVSRGRSLGEPRVHFEAPPSERVPGEMAAFIAWFNATSPSGDTPLPTLARAGVVHLYFESIHPFEDGNGRIGRALSEKAISQNLGCATYSSLASVILARRKAYYAALERGSSTLHITEWLLWFAEATIEAQRRTMALVEFLLAKTRLLDRLRDQLNPRQERVLLRMFREGPEGFKGGLSAGNYMTITGATSATTTRDLADLVVKGALIRRGERRYARYYLAV
jgi:Fic family protein